MVPGDQHGHTLCLGYLSISVTKHGAKATYKGECLFVGHDSRRLGLSPSRQGVRDQAGRHGAGVVAEISY